MSDAPLPPPPIETPFPSVVADFTLTFEEFAEGYQLQRRRKRFLSGPPERSHWIGCAWIGALFVLILVLLMVSVYVTGKSVSSDGKTYVQSDHWIVSFLTGLLPWVALSGLVWIAFARFAIERRIVGRILVLFLLIGAASSLGGALTSPASPESTGVTASPSKTTPSQLLGYLPFAFVVVGCLWLFRDLLRRSVRTAWDGAPFLRQNVHLDADANRLIVQSPLARTEYQWPAVITFSEGEHVFVLSVSALSFHVIPKRALGSAEGAARFRMLLQAKTVDAEPKAQGFSILRGPPIPPPASAPLRVLPPQ